MKEITEIFMDEITGLYMYTSNCIVRLIITLNDSYFHGRLSTVYSILSDRAASYQCLVSDCLCYHSHLTSYHQISIYLIKCINQEMQAKPLISSTHASIPIRCDMH